VPSTIVPPNSFHLLPLASQPSKPQPKANPSNKRKSEEVAKPPASDGPGHSTRKGKGKGKSKSKKNGRRPNVPRDLVGKLWKHQVERAFAGLTTFRQDAMMPATVGNANMVSTCAPNQGARKRTAFRIILDSITSPNFQCIRIFSRKVVSQ
jgi:hypothetical protein